MQGRDLLLDARAAQLRADRVAVVRAVLALVQLVEVGHRLRQRLGARRHVRPTLLGQHELVALDVRLGVDSGNKVETSQLRGGRSRAPEATASFLAAQAALWVA